MGKYVLWAFLGLCAATVAGAGFYLYPAWKGAGILREELDLRRTSFRLELELEEGALAEEQRRGIEVLAKLTGIPLESLYRLSAEGRVWEGRIQMTVFPAGRAEPLAELYLSSDTGVINGTELYNAVRANVVSQFFLLEYLVPKQEKPLCMTFGQAERLFDIDLGGLRGLCLPALESAPTAGQYFLLLASMSREKQGTGQRFTRELGQTQLGIDMPGEGGAVLRFRTEDFPGILAKGEKLASQLGLILPAGDFRVLRSLSLTMTPSEGGAIEIPADIVDQDIVDTIAGIIGWGKEIFGPQE